MHRLTVALTLLTITQASFAAAWVQPKHQWLTIIKGQWYNSCRMWDLNHDSKKASCLRNYELQPYFEIGETDNLTFGISSFVSFQDNANSQSNTRFGGAEMLGRFKLWNNDWSVLSAQLMIDTPDGYRQDGTPPAGHEDWDVEGRLLYGTGGIWEMFLDSSWYFNVEGAYRHRFGPSADQLHGDWAVGAKTKNKKWVLEVKQENIVSTGTTIDASVRTDYQLYKITPSLTHWYTAHRALQLGVSQDLYGRNIRRNTAPFLALWFKS